MAITTVKRLMRGGGSVSAAGKGAGLILTKTRLVTMRTLRYGLVVWSGWHESADAKGNAGVNDDNVLSWQLYPAI